VALLEGRRDREWSLGLKPNFVRIVFFVRIHCCFAFLFLLILKWGGRGRASINRAAPPLLSKFVSRLRFHLSHRV
jgi:hypothetical protein